MEANKNNNIYLKEIYNEFNHFITEFDINSLHELVSKIKEYKHQNIYSMGIGKSENIAKHFADLLRSISFNTFFLNSCNLLHGDIGNIHDKNLIIMFSKSGRTQELIDIIPFLKSRNVFLYGICCEKKSEFEKHCNAIIEIPFKQELSGNINKIPTNSFMNQVIFCNILVSELKNNITLNNYKENHPLGSIGQNLKKIQDVLIQDFPRIILNNECELYNVFLEMTKFKTGCCFFINKNDNLLGILTDGDIRRLLVNKKNKSIITITDLNKKYYYEENIDKFLYECKKFVYIPILSNNKLIGIINNTIT